MNRRLLPFPQNLAPAERAAVEAMVAHGSIGEAAAAIGRTRAGMNTTLQAARARAKVHTTAELVTLYIQTRTA